uniref:Uncharacterized protein n=1 Tax=Ananas comosus var. bracteatus TaxID=296719 RepID=A0A6V7P2J4_ANACO|nr:unnamed protein product [Ananas comosus var. bracteatus]
MQIALLGWSCPRDQSLVRETSPISRGWGSWCDRSLVRVGPVPVGDSSGNNQKSAKSRETSSRGPVSGGQTGLLGTGPSGKDRFPCACCLGELSGTGPWSGRPVPPRAECPVRAV